LAADFRRLWLHRGAGVEELARSAELAGRKFPILPPGADNLEAYNSRCVGCQACTAACPVRIIKVRGDPNPTLEYLEAACQYNCVECGKVCPTGAIRPVSIEEKQRTRIALSSLVFENCVVKTRGQACGACAEVCPTRAVRMTGYSEAPIPGLTRPVFDEEYCIGCGACLVACPAEPRAFTITAVAIQGRTPGMRPSDEGEEAVFTPTEDFPF
jgi:ferredoxin